MAYDDINVAMGGRGFATTPFERWSLRPPLEPGSVSVMCLSKWMCRWDAGDPVVLVCNRVVCGYKWHMLETALFLGKEGTLFLCSLMSNHGVLVEAAVSFLGVGGESVA